MEVSVLGPVAVRRDGVAVTISGARRRTLLCRLAVDANRVVPAEQLVEDLWDGRPTPGAAATLQSHVSHLRRLLGAEHVRREARGYALVLPPGALDTEVVEDEVRRARLAAAAHRWDEVAALAEVALARWRGRPLADVDAGWGVPEVVRLTEVRHELEELRIDALLAAGAHDAAVAPARAAVAATPLRERGWAQLMLALDRSGRHAESRRAFQEARRALADVGLEPSAGLAALDAALAAAVALPAEAAEAAGAREVAPADPDRDPARIPARGPADATPFDSAPADPTPFVGRSAEIAALRAALVRGRRGSRAGLAVVVGEPGIGKTALLDHALPGDGVVLRGRAAPGGAGGFQPVVDALADLAARVSPADGAARLVRSAATRLGPLGPLVVDGAAPDPGTGDPGADRLLLLRNLARLVLDLGDLAAGVGTGTVALVVDDAHHLDAGTTDLLRYLLDQVGPALVVVVALRAGEVDAAAPIAALLADEQARGGVVEVCLHGLSPDAVARLVDHAKSAGRRVGEAIQGLQVQRLWEATGGNPFLVLELAAGAGTDGSGPVPRSIDSAVRARLGRLHPRVASTVAAAAVLGPDVSVALLADVLHVPPAEVLDHLDAALGAGLLAEPGGPRPAADADYVFSPPLVAEVVAASTSAARRRHLHRSAASALAGRGPAGRGPAGRGPAGRGPALAAKVAHHRLAGAAHDDIAEVVAAVQAAAAAALGMLSPADAAVWFERGLDVATDAGAAAGDLAALAAGLARARWEAGHPQAAAALERAAAAAAESGDPDRLAAVALVGSRGWASSMGVIVVDRIDLLERALAAGPSPLVRAELQADLATELMFVDAARARPLAQEAVAIVEAAGAPDEPGEVDAWLHVVRRAAAVGGPGLAEWIAPRLAPALRLAAARADRVAEWETAVVARLTALAVGDAEGHAAAIDAGRRAAGGCDVPRVRFGVELEAARVALIEGYTDLAEHHVDRYVTLADANGYVDGALFAHLHLASIAHQRGEPGAWHPLDGWLVDAVAALTLSELGRLDEAAARVAATRDAGGLATLPRDVLWAGTVGAWGIAAARVGDLVVADEAATLLEPFVGQVCEHVGPVRRVLGLVAAAHGRTAEALDLVGEAECEAAAFGQRFVALSCRVEAAEAATVAGFGGDSLTDASSASLAALAEADGFAGLARRARALACR